jgi:hypothetical protein
MTSADNTALRSAIRDGFDRHGGDLSRWPDRALAKEAGMAALADRDLRASLDDARALDRGLASVREAYDAEITTSGAIDRVMAGVLAGTKPRPFGRLRWAAAIAVIVCAAGLGSMADFRIADPGDEALVNVVVLDPLVFGPMTSDDR